MNVQSVNGSQGLPREDQPVEFFLDGRDTPIVGIYGEQTFRSRWSGYAIDRVSSWRSVGIAERAPASLSVGVQWVCA